MKKLLAILAVTLSATSANAFDVADLANKVQSTVEKASTKIKESQDSTEAQKAKTRSEIENKIADLKEKIANWQASNTANSPETLQAIAKAKESIEKLVQQLKALQ